jgi:ArsR family transcriptional regulator
MRVSTATRTDSRTRGEALPLRVRGCCAPVARPLTGRRAEDLAAVFHAIADPTRVQMLHMLKAATAPICVCDFTAAFDLGQPTVSHHLTKLRDAGFVSSMKKGIWTFHTLRPDMPATARTALDIIP